MKLWIILEEEGPFLLSFSVWDNKKKAHLIFNDIKNKIDKLCGVTEQKLEICDYFFDDGALFKVCMEVSKDGFARSVEIKEIELNTICEYGIPLVDE